MERQNEGIPTVIGGGLSLNASAQGASVPSRESCYNANGCPLGVMEQFINAVCDGKVRVVIKHLENHRNRPISG